MKKARYTTLDGRKLVMEYDENAPCISCGLPVISASMGGTAVCSWCDSGVGRDGKQLSYKETIERQKRANESLAKNEAMVSNWKRMQRMKKTVNVNERPKVNISEDKITIK